MTASDIRRVCVIGAGVMGAGIAAQVANAGVPVLLLDIVPKDVHALPNAPARTAARSPAAPSPRCSRPSPRTVHVARGRAVGRGRQHRRRPRQGGGLRLDRRGRDRAARPEAGPLPAAGGGHPSRYGRVVQYVDDPARGASSAGCRKPSPKASSSPISSIRRVTCGCSKSCRDRPPIQTSWPASSASPITRWASRSCAARTRRASSPTASAAYWLQRGMNAAVDLGLYGRGGRCRDGPAVRHPQDRRLRPARPRRPRPHAAHRREHEGAAQARGRLCGGLARQPAAHEDDRRGLHRPEGQGRLLPDQPRARKGEGVDRPRHRRIRALGRLQAARGSLARYAQARRDRTIDTAEIRLGRDGRRARPMRPRSCPRSRTTWQGSTPRCGSASTGSRGRSRSSIRLGPAAVAARLERDGRAVPESAGGGRQRHFLPCRWTAGSNSSVPTGPTTRSSGPRSVLLLEDVKRKSQPLSAEWLGRALGRRRRTSPASRSRPR